MANFLEQWLKSVIPSQQEVEAADRGVSPFGSEAVSIGFLSLPTLFNRLLSASGTIPSPAENTLIKTHGNLDWHLPKGYEHMKDALGMIEHDQMQRNPLYKHSRIEFTVRQSVLQSRLKRRVHIDPATQTDSVAPDEIYFLSNSQGSIVQTKAVRDPEGTLNKYTPEELIGLGLMRRAKSFELVRGRQDTYHVQGADTYEKGRTLLRVTIIHPNLKYFQNLPDSEKALLSEDFRSKHDIKLSQLATLDP